MLIDAHNSQRRHDIDGPRDVCEILAECNLDAPNWETKRHPFSRHDKPKAENSTGFKSTCPPDRVLFSFVIATTFHFLTNLPAFSVSYFTPTVGLGCRSGGYLLYFIGSFLSAFILVSSTWLSKRWYWHYLDLKSNVLQMSESRLFNFIKFLAVATRFTGKALAYGNSVWIILVHWLVLTLLVQLQCTGNAGREWVLDIPRRSAFTNVCWTVLEGIYCREFSSDVSDRWYSLCATEGL